MTIRFSDGMAIGTDGEPRIIRKGDGLYVVGNGTLCAVRTYSEGWELVQEMKAAMAKDVQASERIDTPEKAEAASAEIIDILNRAKPQQSAFEFLNDKLKAAVEATKKDNRTEKELIKEAWSAQDACNVSGLVFDFAKAMRRLCELVPAGRNKHLVTQLWASKIADLAGEPDWEKAAGIAKGDGAGECGCN